MAGSIVVPFSSAGGNARLKIVEQVKFFDVADRSRVNCRKMGGTARVKEIYDEGYTEILKPANRPQDLEHRQTIWSWIDGVDCCDRREASAITFVVAVGYGTMPDGTKGQEVLSVVSSDFIASPEPREGISVYLVDYVATKKGYEGFGLASEAMKVSREIVDRHAEHRGRKVGATVLEVRWPGWGNDEPIEKMHALSHMLPGAVLLTKQNADGSHTPVEIPQIGLRRKWRTILKFAGVFELDPQLIVPNEGLGYPLIAVLHVLEIVNTRIIEQCYGDTSYAAPPEKQRDIKKATRNAVEFTQGIEFLNSVLLTDVLSGQVELTRPR